MIRTTKSPRATLFKLFDSCGCYPDWDCVGEELFYERDWPVRLIGEFLNEGNKLDAMVALCDHQVRLWLSGQNVGDDFARLAKIARPMAEKANRLAGILMALAELEEMTIKTASEEGEAK